jgi:hypothetical protein
MNIKDAKEQIKNAMMAYFTKDEHGNYIIPVQKQRPVFLEIKGKHPSTSKKRGVLLEVTQMNKYKIYEEGF